MVGRFGGAVLIPLHFGGADADERADLEALQLALVDQLPNDASAASPAIGQLSDGVWPNVVLWQDVAGPAHWRLLL